VPSSAGSLMLGIEKRYDAPSAASTSSSESTIWRVMRLPLFARACVRPDGISLVTVPEYSSRHRAGSATCSCARVSGLRAVADRFNIRTQVYSDFLSMWKHFCSETKWQQSFTQIRRNSSIAQKSSLRRWRICKHDIFDVYKCLPR
jgi:hypothetical protein